MNGDSPARVHYYDRQYLRTQDFDAEQHYHLTAHRRHDIAHHVWGIVAGLAVIASGDGELTVQPGVAVDGYGRLLVLTSPAPISSSAFTDRGSDVLDVWLEYDRSGSDAPPAGYGDCGDEEAGAFYRWQERPLVRVSIPDPDFPDRRRPETVPPADLEFDPSRTPPDAPEDDWPVFLGQVTRDPASPDQPFSIDLGDRPYAGLVGEFMIGASRRAILQLGPLDAADPDVVALRIPEAETAADRGLPRLAFTRTGKLTLRGETTHEGNLTLAGQAVEFEPGDAAAQLGGPWRVYHLQSPADEHELRIEMARAPAGAATGNNSVVIGSWGRTTDASGAQVEAFKPCLTVTDDCTVTVHGKLVVEGQIVDQQGLAAGGLSAEAAQLVLGSLGSGIAGAGSVLGRVFREPDAATARRVVSRMAMSMAPQESLQAVADRLSAEPDRVEEFAELLFAQHPAAARMLADTLGKVGA